MEKALKAEDLFGCGNESGSLAVIDSHDHKKIIYIIGEINENVANETIKTLLETDWVTENKKEIHIYVTSQGGYLSDCFAIIDLVLHIKNQYGLKIFTYGLGEIASAGFFIFLLGDVRTVFPSCRVFVHTHITIGDERTYEERLKADKTDEKDIYDNYILYTAKQLEMTIPKAKKLLKNSKWLRKKEIITYNISKE